MKPIRVMCVDDHHLIHKAVKSLLANEESIELVAEGYAGEDIFPLIKQHQPDVLILDLVMPQRRGWDPNREMFIPMLALKKLNAEFPSLGIIILSQHLHFDIVELAIANGVRGYLLKSDDVSLALPEAIKQVGQGRVFFSVAVSQEVLHPVNMPVNETITLRQRQIILAVAKSPNTSYCELADQLGISYRTFKGHLEGAYKALAVSNVTACIIRSMQLGLIPFMPDGKGISFGNL